MPGYFDEDMYGQDAGAYGLSFDPGELRRGTLSRFGFPPTFPAGRRPQASVNPQQSQPPRIGPSMRILGPSAPEAEQSPAPETTTVPVNAGGVLPAGQQPIAFPSRPMLPAKPMATGVNPAFAPRKGKQRPYMGPSGGIQTAF